MENKIYVKEKISYGQLRYYPDCCKSKMFASLTRKKTLELLELQEISGILGFDVVRRIYDDVNDVTYNIRMIEKGKELAK